MQRLQAWMRNERKKRLGAGNISSMCKTSARNQLGSRKRCHQEEEVYKSLYKDKLQALYEEAFAKLADESGDSGNDSESRNSKKARLKEMRSNRMKIRHEVCSKAWATEDDEVKERVRNELEVEKQEMEQLELGEVEGLARTTAQRQEYVRIDYSR